MAGMETRVIRPEGRLYEQARQLRFRALRAPLGMPKGSEAYSAELDCVHLVAVLGAEVLGSAMFHPQAPGSGRLLQMVVDEAHRGRGVGRAIVRSLERHVRERLDVREVRLHARAPVVPFYEALGYEVVGEAFEEVGIAHRHMRRSLGT
jgi:predicted GNAT family N-acyltransferase